MKAAPSYAAVSGTNFLISLQLKHGSESLGPKHFCNGESHAAFKVSLFVGYNYGLRVIFQERNYETCESSLTSVFRRPSCKQKIIARVFLFIGSSKAKKHLFEAGNRRIVFSAKRFIYETFWAEIVYTVSHKCLYTLLTFYVSVLSGKEIFISI